MRGMREIAVVMQLWRYPVKSLKRQPLAVAKVQFDGIAGDREKALFVRSGHSRIEKTYRGKEHHLLHTLTSAKAVREQTARNGVELELRSGERYFDAAPISIVVDTWLRQAESLAGRELDPQRFRPNIFARAEPTFDASESSLVGNEISIGSVLLRVREPIKRCMTITYDVNSGEPDTGVLRSLTQARDNTMGIYCDVLIPGSIRVGQSISTDGPLLRGED